MTISQQIHSAADATPGWLNWVIIGGSAALSWLQPVAAVIAIVWGGLQIYLAVEKRWFPRDRRPKS